MNSIALKNLHYLHHIGRLIRRHCAQLVKELFKACAGTDEESCFPRRLANVGKGMGYLPGEKMRSLLEALGKSFRSGILPARPRELGRFRPLDDEYGEERGPLG